MTIVDACRAAAKRPVLERLRFYESLERVSVDEAAAIVDALVLPDDYPWVWPALARLVPIPYWLHVHEPYPADRYGLEQVTNRYGEDWVAALVEVLPREPQRILPRLAALDPELLGPAWPCILLLASHDDPYVRYDAARLAMQRKRITPAVLTAFDAYLGELTEPFDNDYDRQLEIEKVLRSIADAGPLAVALAPRVRTLLSSGFRDMAAEAAGELGDPSLIADLERLVRHERDIDRVRSRAHFALWRLTGTLDYLDRALADAGTSTYNEIGIRLAWERFPDERMLAGLAHAARDPVWHPTVCEALATIGPPGASTMQQIEPPPPDAYSDERRGYHHARWRTGLIDGATLVTALQPLLESSWHAWQPYVDSDVGSAVWADTIRSGLGTKNERAVLEALCSAPQVGRRFVPDLVATGHDDEVESLWRQLPAGEFWPWAERS